MNSAHPDKEMRLCAFPWLHLWMRHSSTIHQALQIRIGWEVRGDKWNEEQKPEYYISASMKVLPVWLWISQGKALDPQQFRIWHFWSMYLFSFNWYCFFFFKCLDSFLKHGNGIVCVKSQPVLSSINLSDKFWLHFKINNLAIPQHNWFSQIWRQN